MAASRLLAGVVVFALGGPATAGPPPARVGAASAPPRMAAPPPPRVAPPASTNVYRGPVGVPPGGYRPNPVAVHPGYSVPRTGISISVGVGSPYRYGNGYGYGYGVGVPYYRTVHPGYGYGGYDYNPVVVPATVFPRPVVSAPVVVAPPAPVAQPPAVPGETALQVTAVSPGPAYESGLRVGDLIYAANGVRVQTGDDLRRIVAASAAGEVELEFLKPQDRRTAAVKVTPRDGRLGLTVEPIPVEFQK